MPTPSGDNSYLNCRFGVGAAENPVTTYDLAPLNLGWYANWAAQETPARPGGIEYVQLLSVSDGAEPAEPTHPDPPSYYPSGSHLAAIAAANPGSLWLVGNEPDCIHQDNVLPENYAVAYHDAYAAIKAVDPSARVSVGGIVQPTPLRLEYLEKVLNTYRSQYGAPLPTDAWNIHSYILREGRTGWGCGIPPGSRATHGEDYDFVDTDDINIFRQRIEDFRGWMRDRGYGDKPLIISEYGTLFPYYDGDPLTFGDITFDEARAQHYMTRTFDLLLSASDPDVGYQPDENRLVQRWLWYSLDDTGYGGLLFDPHTHEPMDLGISFGDYTSAISPHVDLFAVEVNQVGSVPFVATGSATATVKALVSNVGNIVNTTPVRVRFLDAEGQPIGGDHIIDQDMPGCAATEALTLTWPNLEPGVHEISVVVDPDDEVGEGNETNNVAYGTVLIGESRLWLPLAIRQG
jgi:hypothetical protein